MNQERVVLVVDDEAAHRLMIRAHLEEEGYQVLEAPDGAQALETVSSQAVDLVIMDVVMPRMDGMASLKKMASLIPGTPILIMTAYGSIDQAVAALKTGAADFITKPLDMEAVLIKVGRQLEAAGLARRLRVLAERLGERFDFSALWGDSRPMTKLKETLAMVAPAEATVLITGQSGTGKEVTAQIIHQNSPRKDGPLIKVNCAALPDALLESELFGHVKGAFTGALKHREGRWAAADGGTIFLDEIGEMSPTLQAKLLRALQEGEYTPLGWDQVKKADVRVLAATNRDLTQAVQDSEFREDLYYRLNVVNLHMPPLSQRGDDALGLAQRYLKEFNQKNRRNIKGFSQEAEKLMLAYHWPGNVRELINAVERAVIMAPGPLVEPGDLPLALQGRSQGFQPGIRAGMTIYEVERLLIEATLDATGGNRTRSAEMLGITRKTLQNKIKEYGLPPAK